MPTDYTQAGGSQYRAPANRWDAFKTDKEWQDWIPGANQDGQTRASATGLYNSWKQQQANQGTFAGSGGGGGGPTALSSLYGNTNQGGGVSPYRVMPDAQQTPSASPGVQTTDSVLAGNNRRPVLDLTMPDLESGLPLGPSAPQMWDPGAGVRPPSSPLDVPQSQQTPTGHNDQGVLQSQPGVPSSSASTYAPPPMRDYYADLVNPYTGQYAEQLGGRAASNVNEQGAHVADQLREQAAIRGLSQAGYSGIEAQGQRQNAQETAIARAKAYTDALLQTKQLGSAFDFTKAGGQTQYQGQALDAYNTNALMTGRITSQDLANLAASRGISRNDAMLPGDLEAQRLTNTGASIRNTGGALSNQLAAGVMPYQEEAARLANIDRSYANERSGMQNQKDQLELATLKNNWDRIQTKIAQGLDLDVTERQYKATLEKWAAEHPDTAAWAGIIGQVVGGIGGAIASNWGKGGQ